MAAIRNFPAVGTGERFWGDHPLVDLSGRGLIGVSLAVKALGTDVVRLAKGEALCQVARE